MGMAMGNGGGGRRGRRGKARFNDINVTPMVDVMLVLLIIFMVAAPMLTSGVEVDLPKASTQPLTGQDEPLTVSIEKSGQIYVQKGKVSLSEIGAKLKAIAKEKSDTRILVRGDGKVDYARIMQVVGEINGAGFTKVALVTESPDAGHKR